MSEALICDQCRRVVEQPDAVHVSDDAGGASDFCSIACAVNGLIAIDWDRAYEAGRVEAVTMTAERPKRWWQR